MSYTPTNWVNGETPINAENLNKIEQELVGFNRKYGDTDISGIGGGTVTGAIFELNGKSIKSTEIAFGLSQALAAGAYGFGSSNINVSGDIELLYAHIQTNDIAGMNGLQATPVYLKNQILYYSYYAPQPVTSESLNTAKWIVYYI